MALHDSLRELVAARGAAVVDDATELRGALDDFLGEDEATIGELNLLVDAVRLGGLDRLLTMLDNGAAPAAAVAEAGAALARDRGSDDSRRAGWAVAALGFALGRLDAGVVERSLPTAAPVDPKPATPPPPPPPPPTPQPSPDPDPGPGTVGSAEAVPTAFDRERSVPMSPPPAAPGAPRRKRRSVVLLAVSFAVVLGLVGGIGLALWMERDTATKANDPDEASTASDPSTDATEDEPATIPKTDILVTYVGEDERVDRVDVNGGRVKKLTKGPQDHLPSISPDRTEVAYLVGAAGEPRILMVHDVASGRSRELFEGEGPCANSVRPGWSLDGAWMALICAGDDDEKAGIYMANPVNGATYALVTDSPPLNGSPTWVDENTIVYTQTDSNGRPTSLWSLDIDLGVLGPAGPPVQLIHEPDPAARLSHPDWSEEAGKLLYVVHADDDALGDVWVADEKLQGAEPLGGPYGHPVWSPDGDAIAFTVKEGEGDDAVEKLAVADFDGEKLSEPDILDEVPDGEVGIPVWGSR